MSFKTIKLNGDGMAQYVVSTGIDTEAVTTGMIVYNEDDTSPLDLEILIDDVTIIRENIEPSVTFRLAEKINIEPGRSLKLNMPVGLAATVMYYQQPISEQATLNALQRMVNEMNDKLQLAEGHEQAAEQYAIEARSYRNTYTIGGLIDVDAPAPNDNEALVYDALDGKYVNRKILTVGEYTSLDARITALETP